MSALPKFTCPTASHPDVKLSGRTDAKTTRNSTRQQHSHQLPTTQPLAQPATKAWTTTPNSNPSISYQRQLQTAQLEQENVSLLPPQNHKRKVTGGQLVYADLVEQERLIQNRRMAAKHASKLKTRKQHQEV
ncbi:hypothetical protein DYB26_010251 [Aphanomyces astaci]|uniref:Uncharacterized protein n=1 Tax=Aphanomyces astaci TaxID=112090 RepID=A0A397FH11_APHAT|nr:hypothetical protein DYB36_011510 [Aphanomyces astaci]RHZ25038.1 hypothetical protein DYB31_012274 [Aphanomyces astaci]RHZ25475.1 hypothetical protein DYB26_010251 [Aphanomyces astaci]